MGFEVFDYRKDVRNVIIEPEIRARFFRLEPGEVARAHTHDLGQEVFLVLQGRVEFEIEGHKETLGPGQLCFAAAGESHISRCVGDQPVIYYLSVTPHIEPTHTHWDEGGSKLPPRYGGLSLREPDHDIATPVQKADASAAAAAALGRSAVENAAAQGSGADRVKRALAAGDRDAAKAVIDEMWTALHATFESLRELGLAWNELAALFAEDRKA
jgi:quercetin dioxygenase-like cupin family protein